MPVPLEQFVKQLEDSGILTADTLQEFLPPKSEPKDAEVLARELIRKKKLTKFQAEEVYRGNGKSLVLGNYVLMEKIGAGGMGQVFKAEHRRMHRIVAVKMLPSGMMKNPALVARFEREVTAAAKLNHPNIVTAFDADNANDLHLLIMEYVEGTDLSVLVKKNGPVPVERAMNYILQTARGLEAAHAEGIVHRDIKPANLLLDKKGTVKILDMGLARLSADVDAGQAELTNTGTVMGTVDYMAPEQALNTKTADARADIYSLGCSLFYLLTGKAAYGGDTLMAKLLAHRDQPIPSIREIRPEVPEQVEAVFNGMVAKRIEDRYQTMTEVIANLERLAQGQAPSINSQAPSASFADVGLTNFLNDISLSPATPTKPRKGSFDNDWIKQNKKRLLIGGSALGVLTLVVGLVVGFRTKDGTLVAGGKRAIKTEPKRLDDSVADAKALPSFESPEFKKWMKEVASLPAEQQVKAVSTKLVELNPGFDGNVTPTIQDGSVTGLMFLTNDVTDISPVRALKRLQILACNAVVPGTGKLADLSPLKGMSLTVLNCFCTQVSDLSPLKGMRLTVLSVDHTQVMDLKPLKGMPLVSLSCRVTPVNNLVPLQGMALTLLQFDSTKVEDLSPLKGMPLTGLHCAGTPVANLSPLNFTKLTTLDLSGTKVTDLSALKGTSVTSLNINDTAVSDLSPLKGMPLQALQCQSTKVADLTPLEGMPLTNLRFGVTQVSDLSPLKGMALTNLSFMATAVSDLSPLKELKLTSLECFGTQIADLSPLKGMPLEVLHCHNTPTITDLSPLKDLPLKNLICDFKPESDTELIRSIKTLEFINGKQAAEFWKQFEKQPLAFETPSFNQWANDVLVMPAEKQVIAVAKKLQELNPGFDGKVTPIIQSGVVTGLYFLTDNVTDISPVRALVGLSLLNCSGESNREGKLIDLSPLKGMPLKSLEIQWTRVADLSPLQGINLRALNCAGTRVADLSALEGMPIHTLSVISTQVADLSPLHGMPMLNLQCSSTPIADLKPLMDLPLTHILCDFKPDRDMEILRSIKSLEVINGKPATQFWMEVEGQQAAF